MTKTFSIGRDEAVHGLRESLIRNLGIYIDEMSVDLADGATITIEMHMPKQKEMTPLEKAIATALIETTSKKTFSAYEVSLLLSPIVVAHSKLKEAE